jgi:FPC/CPF motif-containing protein YcgG
MADDNPFSDDLAVRNSSYYAMHDGKLYSEAENRQHPDLFVSAVHGAFREYVLNPMFSCVGAKSAVHNNGYRLGVYERLAGAGSTAGLSRDLYTFAQELEHISSDFATFVAVFREPIELDETGFEQLLWAQLRQLHERDARLYTWDPSVDPDPNNPHFSFSFAGEAFFIVGLHPHSSRTARRFPWPALVFNPHAQFERLKEQGQWERMKEVIRRREQELQGEINPMLCDYGEESEARQYSGRRVDPNWHAPFNPHPKRTK